MSFLSSIGLFVRLGQLKYLRPIKLEIAQGGLDVGVGRRFGDGAQSVGVVDDGFAVLPPATNHLVLRTHRATSRLTLRSSGFPPRAK